MERQTVKEKEIKIRPMLSNKNDDDLTPPPPNTSSPYENDDDVTPKHQVYLHAKWDG